MKRDMTDFTAFVADLMRVLTENSHKPCWRTLSYYDIEHLVDEELGELDESRDTFVEDLIRYGLPAAVATNNASNLQKEILDTCNALFFLYSLIERTRKGYDNAETRPNSYHLGDE